MSHITHYLQRAAEVLERLDHKAIQTLVDALVATRERGGRLFVLGVGGSAANAAHAVNDFRKLAGMEAYAPTDNVSELTARTNDEGWGTVFAAWLAGSRLGAADAILVLSVGGGDPARGVSTNLVRAVEYARAQGATVCGIVGRDGGFTAAHADACVVVPPVDAGLVTPLTEAFQAVVWHLVVTHPAVQVQPTKW
jgi:D-sedoheptulose 7-phosphate isomerase